MPWYGWVMNLRWFQIMHAAHWPNYLRAGLVQWVMVNVAITKYQRVADLLLLHTGRLGIRADKTAQWWASFKQLLIGGGHANFSGNWSKRAPGKTIAFVDVSIHGANWQFCILSSWKLLPWCASSIIRRTHSYAYYRLTANFTSGIIIH